MIDPQWAGVQNGAEAPASGELGSDVAVSFLAMVAWRPSTASRSRFPGISTDSVSDPALKRTSSHPRRSGSTYTGRLSKFPNGGTLPLTSPVSRNISSSVASRTERALVSLLTDFQSSFRSAGNTHSSMRSSAFTVSAFAPVLNAVPRARADSELVVAASCRRTLCSTPRVLRRLTMRSSRSAITALLGRHLIRYGHAASLKSSAALGRHPTWRHGPGKSQSSCFGHMRVELFPAALWRSAERLSCREHTRRVRLR